MKKSLNLGGNNFNNNRIGQTIEEKMKEYNEMKATVQNATRNKGSYKKNNNSELAMTPWKNILLISLVFIVIGSIILYMGIINVKKTIVNSQYRVYTRGEITNISFAMGDYETRLEIEYEVDGKIYESTLESKKDRNEFMIGQILGIYYYKDNPNRIYDTSDEVSNFGLPVIGAIFIILGFVCIFAKVKAGNIKRKR